eukprot:14711431-Ditylum_brightwellii.AAC.1
MASNQHRKFTLTRANKIAVAMKKGGLNIPEYLQIQGKICHYHYPQVKQLMEDPVTGVNLTQYHISKGLKVFGKDGYVVVDMKVWELVMRINGQGCTDIKKQKKYTH